MKCDPENLNLEIIAARSIRDSHLFAMDDMVKRFAQRDYKGFEDCDFAPENHEGEYTALMLPKIAFSEPRVRVKCRRPGPGKMEAIALRYALNQWAEDTCLGEVMQDVVRDYLFNFGVYYTTQDPQPGAYGDNPSRPYWPKVQRLSQKQFLMDPLCGFFKAARWAGHEYAIEKETLIQMATDRPELGWDVNALDEMSTTQDFDWRPEMDEAPDREEFRIIRVWVPGQYEPGAPGPEAGYNGTIYTIVNGQDTTGIEDWIRKPIPAYGPRWGPYALAGAYGVPDSAWPLGPLTMAKGRTDELNAHAVAASKAMAEYKRLVLVDASHPQLAQMLKRPDQFVIPIKGLNKDNVVQLEMAGLTPQHLQALSVLKDRLDRASGMSDAKRGNASSGATATADAIADESSTVRIAYLKQRHTQAVVQVYQTAGWYMLKDDRVVFPLGDQAAMELGMQDPHFVGGAAANAKMGVGIAPMAMAGMGARGMMPPGQGMMGQQPQLPPVNPDDMLYSIEPFSMDYVGQGVAKQQFMQAVGLALQMAQMMPQMPYVKWRDMFTKLGDAFNDDDWAEIVEPDLAAMMGGLQRGLPASPQPQFASMEGSQPAPAGPPQLGPSLAPGNMNGMGGSQGSEPDMLMTSLAAPGRMAGGIARRGAA